MTAISMNQAQSLLTGLVRLEAESWQRLRSDPAYTLLAVGVMVAAVLLGGLGSYLWIGTQVDWSGEFFLKSVLVGGFLTLALWAGVAAVTMVLLKRDLPGVSFMETLRVGGVALAPFGLAILAIIPELNYGIALASLLATSALFVVALQLGFGVTPRTAFLAAVAPMAAWAILLPLFVTADDPFGAGVFAFDFSNEILEGFADSFGGRGGFFDE